jgi:plasmid stability protein
MATLTVRNIPEDVLRSLKTLARMNHRSMEEELRRLIESKAMDRLSVLRQVEASWKRQKRPTTRREVERWIRESRP